MTDADFLSITLNGKLCDGEGGMGLLEFERVMREQVRLSPPPPRISSAHPRGQARSGPA
jgi:hypothetical protein